MAKALRGECEVELAGEKFTLRLSLGNLEELEGQLGIGIIKLANRFTSMDAKLSDARAVLRQGFVGAKIKMSEERLAKLIEDTGFAAVQQAAALLLAVLTDKEGNADAVAAEAK